LKESSIAVFIDFENLALGVRDLEHAKSFQVQLILKRLLEKGRVVYKRAYSDWSHYRNEMRAFHEQGIEMIDIPQTRVGGKNSADIRMVVDAIDLCHIKENIDTFALVSGDSDFSPLVSKLKENDKRVIGCGVKNSTSSLLVANCDEFIYYDDLVRATAEKPAPAPKKTKRAGEKTAKDTSAPRRKAKVGEAKPETDDRKEAIKQVIEIIRSLQADYDPLWGSLVKQTVRRVYPSFNEAQYGYHSFSELLEDVEDLGYIDLEYDKSRGNYKISLVTD